jgi:hypothetical protein
MAAVACGDVSGQNWQGYQYLRLRGGVDDAAGKLKEVVEVRTRCQRLRVGIRTPLPDARRTALTGSAAKPCWILRPFAVLTFALSQVPAEKIGMVIGKSGATIKELERLSGCQIWVDAKTNVPG